MKSVRWPLALIPCTARKNPMGLTARTLYSGAGFSLMMRHAQQRCTKILIMSAKYGLLEPDAAVSYYDAFLPELTADQLSKLIELLRWQALGIEEPFVLSYLPRSYHLTLATAAPLLATRCRRPYGNCSTYAITEILFNEIQNYGKNPARR